MMKGDVFLAVLKMREGPSGYSTVKTSEFNRWVYGIRCINFSVNIFDEMIILTCKTLKYCTFLILISLSVFSPTLSFSEQEVSLLEVTPRIREYAINTIKPVLDSCTKRDKLSLLLKISDILVSSELGIHINEIEPSTFIIYDKLEKLKLGFLISFKLSPEQKNILKEWHSKFMYKNPANVFFAPSADDIIKSRAAFGCSHYARSFIAVVKALDLMDSPEDLRYVISSKADDYDKALEKMDSEMTINGHQFVIAKIDSKWIALNTSKSEWTQLPDGFIPDSIVPPKNIPIRFESYPDVTFLLRKIGKDYNDDCNDNSLAALMNIYRSGDINDPNFKWEEYSDKSS
jgi:hypothetical protein